MHNYSKDAIEKIKGECKKTSFPDKFQPMSKKGMDYCRQYAMASFSEYLQESTLMNRQVRETIVRNRLYMDARQDLSPVRAKFPSFKNKENQNVSYVDLNYKPLGIIQKLCDAVKGICDKRNYNPVISAIDPNSVDQKAREKTILWATQIVNDELEEADQKMGYNPPKNEIRYGSKEELDLAFQEDYKLLEEAKMQAAIQSVFESSSYPEVKRQMVEDNLSSGYMICRDYVDKDGSNKIEYIDSVNTLMRNTRDKRFLNTERIGVIKETTIGELAEMGCFKMEELKEIQRLTNGIYQSSDTNTSTNGFVDTDSDEFRDGFWGTLQNNHVVRYVDIEWDDIIQKYRQVYVNEVGKELYIDKGQTPPPQYEYKILGEGDEKKFIEVNITNGEEKSLSESTWKKKKKKKEDSQIKVKRIVKKVIMGCKWIIGTNYAWDCGPIPNQIRPDNDYKNPRKTFHIYRTTNTPFVSRLIPFEDAINLDWIKLQNEKARAKPKGIQIEIDALENLTVGGEKWKPLRALAYYQATGDVIFKGTGYDEAYSRYNPIQSLNVNGLEHIPIWINDINNNIQMAYQISGVNEYQTGTSPEPRTAVGVNMMSTEGTDNMLQNMFVGTEDVTERVVESVGLKIWCNLKYGLTPKMLTRTISELGVKVIKNSTSLQDLRLAYNIEMAPSVEQKRAIMEAARAALQTRNENGESQLIYSDFLLIERYLSQGKIKLAELTFDQRYLKRKKEAQEYAMMMADRQGQMANEGKMIDLQSAREQRAYEEKKMMAELNAKHQSDVILKQMDLSIEAYKQRGAEGVQELKNKGVIDKIIAENTIKYSQALDNSLGATTTTPKM